MAAVLEKHVGPLCVPRDLLPQTGGSSGPSDNLLSAAAAEVTVVSVGHGRETSGARTRGPCWQPPATPAVWRGRLLISVSSASAV